jgi:hypothetical protein
MTVETIMSLCQQTESIFKNPFLLTMRIKRKNCKVKAEWYRIFLYKHKFCHMRSCLVYIIKMLEVTQNTYGINIVILDCPISTDLIAKDPSKAKEVPNTHPYGQSLHQRQRLAQVDRPKSSC